MFKTRLRIALVVAAVLLPFILHQVYSWMTALPADIVVATGPENGLYRGMWKELGREIKDQLKVNVRFRHTGGSTENLELLENGDIDFCLCQGGPTTFSAVAINRLITSRNSWRTCTLKLFTFWCDRKQEFARRQISKESESISATKGPAITRWRYYCSIMSV
jgi:hypothetical protein